MQTKTIQKVLRKKFDDFLQSIKDPKVKALVRENSIITGGAIASMLLQEDVNDYDLYFTNKETTLAVANYYVGKFNKDNNFDAEVLDGKDFTSGDELEDKHLYGAVKNLDESRVKIYVRSSGVAKEKEDKPLDEFPEEYQENNNKEVEDLKKPRYRPVFLSSNAITLSQKVQLIIRFYGDAEEIHSNYDFTHCTSYWESKTGKLTLNPKALECLLSRTLIYQGSKYPLCSVIRTRKFIKRGYRINAGQYLKMMFQISQLDLTDISVLEDQLIGVDSAYFNALINALKKKKEEDPSFTLSDGLMSGYIVELIDKIF